MTVVAAIRALPSRTRIIWAAAIGALVIGAPTALVAVQLASAETNWVAPVNAPIWGGFRVAPNPAHDGVDLGAKRFVPIRAASAGTVVVRECNAHVGDTPYSCDKDGSPTVKGCGWFVDIAHAGRIVTRYCHMSFPPLVNLGDTVTTGQIIGYVGSSGNSSAPHLHFEVHVIPKGDPIDAESDNAVDPVPFMAAHGAPLGKGNDAPAPPTPTPTPPKPPATPVPHDPNADLDGDGTSDLAVWRPNEGLWYVLGTDAPVQLGVPGDEPVVADYDGDGRDDLAVWRRADGRWLVQTSSGAPTSDPVLGSPEDFPVPADYNGDGRAEIAVWQPFTGRLVLLAADGTKSQPVTLGQPGDLPVVADYDGDGHADFAVWRPSDGRWLIHASSGINLPEVTLGADGDIPLPADYDGDGLTDFAVWRPAESQWYVRYAATGKESGPIPLAAQTLGTGATTPAPDGTAAPGTPTALDATGAVPVVGDYDGDGRDDLAVWLPGDGRWIIRASSDGTVATLTNGVRGDVPANRPQWLKADGTAPTLADVEARHFGITLRDAVNAAATTQSG
ncbi:MAG TPA: VCBS repeat domain-containing M23 family metallopeptidase [Micromonosporaceae bacterium]